MGVAQTNVLLAKSKNQFVHYLFTKVYLKQSSFHCKITQLTTVSKHPL